MNFKVIWSKGSLEDAHTIISFVKHTTGVSASRKVLEKLKEAENTISVAPHSGKLEKDYHPCRVLHTKHNRFFYTLDENTQTAKIVAVWDNRGNDRKIASILKNRQ